MSWFLFLHNDGSSGVGQCNFSPGILDAQKGVLFVVPEEWIYQFHSKPRYHSAERIKGIILKYFDE